MGRRRGGADHGRDLPGRGGRDGRGDPAVAVARPAAAYARRRRDASRCPSAEPERSPMPSRPGPQPPTPDPDAAGRGSGASRGRRPARGSSPTGTGWPPRLADPDDARLGGRHRARRTCRSTTSRSCSTLHPLIVGGHRGAQPAGQDRGDRRDALHVVLFAILYEGEIAELEIDIVLNHRSLLTVHEPGWDPFTLPQLRGGRRRTSCAAVRTSCSTPSPTASWTATSRCSTAIEDEIDALQDDVIAQARPRGRWSGCSRSSASSSGCAGRSSPAREVFNQLTNRDLGLIERGARHLLPRRLRPPHPGHRRARQRPRARERRRSRSTCRRSTTTCR